MLDKIITDVLWQSINKTCNIETPFLNKKSHDHKGRVAARQMKIESPPVTE